MKVRSFLYKKVKTLFADYFRIILNDADFYRFNYVLELKMMIQRTFMFVSSNLVKGDYYEFGLYKGRSFLFALKEASKRDMHCYGFDSFEGLPDGQIYEDKKITPEEASKKLKFESPATAYNLAYNQGFDDGRSQRRVTRTVYSPDTAYLEDEKLFDETYRRTSGRTLRRNRWPDQTGGHVCTLP